MSDFSCYCEIGEGEPPDFLSIAHPIARKEHTCFECGDPIKQGDKYERVSGKWEGEMECFKICSWCSEMREEMANKLGEFISYGELACAYNQYLRESK